MLRYRFCDSSGSDFFNMTCYWTKVLVEGKNDFDPKEQKGHRGHDNDKELFSRGSIKSIPRIPKMWRGSNICVTPEHNICTKRTRFQNSLIVFPFDSFVRGGRVAPRVPGCIKLKWHHVRITIRMYIIKQDWLQNIHYIVPWHGGGGSLSHRGLVALLLVLPTSRRYDVSEFVKFVSFRYSPPPPLLTL